MIYNSSVSKLMRHWEKSHWNKGDRHLCQILPGSFFVLFFTNWKETSDNILHFKRNNFLSIHVPS
jgi:hypothetical protein